MTRSIPILLLWAITLHVAATGLEPIDIGSRRELFVDDYLIDTLDGARRVLHNPTRREVALAWNKPWEGNHSSWTTVFRDTDIYRMYYRGRHGIYTQGKVKDGHPDVTCYAESKDGIHWTRPKLGLLEFDGSKQNNIVWDDIGMRSFTPFKDANPNCAPDARYKAVGAGGPQAGGKPGVYAFKSPDGIHWTLMNKEPVITRGGNEGLLAFWDSLRGEYRAYMRGRYRHGRDIHTCSSKDFVHWSEPVFLKYSPSRVSQLYTNNVIPYYRAPHIFLGFPIRYVDYDWAESTKQLPQRKYRELVASGGLRGGTAITDVMFISSRDGLHFDVWPESFIRPGIERPGSWFYGDNFQAWGIVETKSHLEGAPNELSFYANEAFRQPNGSRLRRYTMRIDGFVSIRAPLTGGQVVTKPIVFDGKQLEINLSTSAAGYVGVELQDAAGKPIPGFALKERKLSKVLGVGAPTVDPSIAGRREPAQGITARREPSEVFGDSIARVVAWKGGTDLSQLAGQPIRLRFVLKDADLYSLRFRP